MKKVFFVLALFCLTGCNRTVVDTVWKYDKAVIRMGEEVITVEVDSWKDYDGEQIQVVAKDGTVYLTSSFNCTLIKESSGD